MTTFFDAFISYGRIDSKEFAIALKERLEQQGLKIWFDFDNIPYAVDFQNQINDGISRAHNFIFIISPHAVNSPYCLKEIELAIQFKKRIIPLLHIMQISRETWQQRNPKGTDEAWEEYQVKGLHESDRNMHPIIRQLNWLPFEEHHADFEDSCEKLIDLLSYHREYVRQHTDLLAKAIEWEQRNKQNRYLLIGEKKQQALSWLKIRFKDEQPPCIPADLHCEYITESIKNANNLMTQVFISYADEDREIMETICKGLRREGITVWHNDTDIQTGEAFEESFCRGIEQADNIIYLLSQNSIDSYRALHNLDYALSLHKRIIPILVGEVPSKKIPSVLQNLQYLDLTDNENLEDYWLDESQLLKILDRDAPYYKEHKILLTKAIKWKQQGENPSILLRGYNLRSAETWLRVAQTRTQHIPTPLQEEFITQSLRQPPLESLDVFICYSRADSDLARQINDRLQMQGKMTWFDQESIASGTDFQKEMYLGIKACDNFVFIISPRSIHSPYCAGEVEYAASLNKRFVTVLNRRVKSADLHPELTKVQWIDFNRHDRDFNANFYPLVRTLDTDRQHLHNHTKWLQRALEWEERGRSDDLLLHGSESAFANKWLQKTEQEYKKPTATTLQKEFIEASQNAIAAAQAKKQRRRDEMLRLQKERAQLLEEQAREAEARLAQEKKHAKRQRKMLAAVSLLFVAAASSSLVAFSLWTRAKTIQEGHMNSVSRFSLSLLEENRKLDAALEALRAGKQLQEQPQVSQKTRSLVLNALQAAVYRSGFQEKNRLSEHRDSVNSVSFSPDERLEDRIIATASSDNTIKLWDCKGELLQTLEGHEGTVTSISFSPDGKTIVSGSWDNTIRLWSREGKALGTIGGHGDTIYGVSFSPDGQIIASSSQDGTVKLWNLQGELLNTLEHEDGVSSVAWSPDGQTIASTIYDPPIITLWSREGKKLKTLEEGHDQPIHSVRFSPDGKTIASGGDDRKLILWDAQTGVRQRTIQRHDKAVKSVAFSPDSETIASASRDGTVKLWDRKTGVRQRTLKGHKLDVNSVSFSPDGLTIASASTDKTVKLWSFENPIETQILQHLGEGRKAVKSISFSPDGKSVATASEDGTVKIWSREGEGEWLLDRTLPHPGWVSSVSFSRDGQTLATAGKGRTIRLWSREGELLREIPHDDGVNTVSFSPNGKKIAVGNQDNSVTLLNREGDRLGNFKVDEDGGSDIQVLSVAWSPDSQKIAVSSEDKTAVTLWSANGERLGTLEGHQQEVHSISFSPNGWRIATASMDGTVKLWSREGTELYTLEGHDNRVRSVSFSPDSKIVASASDDGTVRLWDADNGEPRNIWRGDSGRVYSVAWSPNGKILASGARNGTVILWNLEDLRLARLMEDACDWVADYLTYNSNVEESDSILCPEIEN
ncbi:TIR domain-containing protein [Oscillatoriales cyanobacterium LEGE 11467]|uniref:TIR domain-containing protein n=1 Tax=Zarconia navalis LEGE 11467 TaxID=1828826 RepID=A0A928Z9D8_9CYAN|nr:TIR domain-containing protein [Zarconia navalis]MBE9041588.1 TIR domain-containing protein [Zarconia navalis LEGE 11467]